MPNISHLKVVPAAAPFVSPLYGGRTQLRPPLAWWVRLLPRRWRPQPAAAAPQTDVTIPAPQTSRNVSVGRRNLAETMVGYGKPSHRAR